MTFVFAVHTFELINLFQSINNHVPKLATCCFRRIYFSVWFMDFNEILYTAPS